MVRQAGQQTRDHTLSVPKYLSNLSCWQNIFHSSSASQTSYTLILPYMCFKLSCIFIFVFEYLFCWAPLSSSVFPSGDPKSPLVSPQGNVYIQYTIHTLSYILYMLCPIYTIPATLVRSGEPSGECRKCGLGQMPQQISSRFRCKYSSYRYPPLFPST